VPEIDQYTFTYKELAEALVKKAGLHTGMWQLFVRFGLGAGNAGPEADQVVPTAFIPLLGIGLMKAKEDGPPGLIVDAAVVNPAPRKAKSSSSSTAKRRRA